LTDRNKLRALVAVPAGVVLGVAGAALFHQPLWHGGVMVGLMLTAVPISYFIQSREISKRNDDSTS
jgi:cytosine/uracil/thiamine/allantoin permease